jgi:hypothetical protein
MVAWWWLPIVAGTAFALGMIFVALCIHSAEELQDR